MEQYKDNTFTLDIRMFIQTNKDQSTLYCIRIGSQLIFVSQEDFSKVVHGNNLVPNDNIYNEKTGQSTTYYSNK